MQKVDLFRMINMSTVRDRVRVHIEMGHEIISVYGDGREAIIVYTDSLTETMNQLVAFKEFKN